MATASKYASSNTSPPTGSGWTALTNPTNAYADDTNYASLTSTTRRQDAGADYGFAAFSTSDIPDNSTINSVTLTARCWGTNATYMTEGIQGVLSGSTSGSEVTTNATSEATITFSSWTSLPTLTNLRNQNVAARIRINHGNTTTSYTGYCDWVQITVDYTPPAVTGSFTADATFKKTGQSGSFTVDAIIRKTQTGVLYIGNNDGTGGAVKNSPATTYTFSDKTANAIILAPSGTKTFTANAIKLVHDWQGYDGDDTWYIDAVFLRNSGTKTGPTLDAIRRANSGTKTFTADATVFATIGKTFAANAVIFQPDRPGTPFAANAVRLQNSGTKTLTADATRLAPSGTKTFSADATFRKTISGTCSVDAVIKRTIVCGPVSQTVETTINRSSTYGDVISSDANYTTARTRAAGDAALTPISTGQAVGQKEDAGPSFSIYESFLGFDTSFLGAGATVTTAELKMYPYIVDGTTNLQVRMRDWGGTISRSCWVPGPDLSALTLVAHYTVTTPNAWITYTDDAMPGNINKTGQTRFIIVSDDTVNGTAPGGVGQNKLIWFYSASGSEQKLHLIYNTATTDHPGLTVDGVFTKTQSGTFTVNAVIRKTQAGSGTVDAVTRKTQSGTGTLDAFVRPYFRVDAYVQSPSVSASFTANAIRKGAGAGTFSVDAIKRTTVSFGAYATLLRETFSSGSGSVNGKTVEFPDGQWATTLWGQFGTYVGCSGGFDFGVVDARARAWVSEGSGSSNNTEWWWYARRASTTYGDVDVLVTADAGSGQQSGAMVRLTGGADTFYMAVAGPGSGVSGVQSGVVRVTANAVTQVATTGDAQYTNYYIRFRVEGVSPTSLKMRRWTSGNEPSSWDVSTTEGTAANQVAAGQAGFVASGGSMRYEGSFASYVDNVEIRTIAPTFSGPTIDAQVKSFRSGTFTLDALKRQPDITPTGWTIQAWRRDVVSSTFKIGDSSNPGGAVIVLVPLYSSFTIDASIFTPRSGSLTLNATRLKSFSGSFTIDAIRRKTIISDGSVSNYYAHDTFTGTDDSLLVNHTPDSGGYWGLGWGQTVYLNGNAANAHTTGWASYNGTFLQPGYVDYEYLYRVRYVANCYMPGPLGRDSGNNAFYINLYNVNTTQWELKLLAYPATPTASSTQSVTKTVTASTDVWVHLKVTGYTPSHVQAKIWSVDQQMPANWDLDIYDNVYNGWQARQVASGAHTWMWYYSGAYLDELYFFPQFGGFTINAKIDPIHVTITPGPTVDAIRLRRRWFGRVEDGYPW